MGDDEPVSRFGREALGDRGVGWRTAFDEAWASWRAGNFGVGAALVDPATGRVVSAGRNRVAQRTLEPGVISGNMTAHAEMNAFAGLRRFNAAGLHLYTTLQPCLMCAASAMLLKVDHVHLAASDEYFDDLDDLWQHHRVTVERVPAITGPFTGADEALAHFARFLPLAFTLDHLDGGAAAARARATHPRLASLADEIRGEEAQALRRLETVDEALDALWDRLVSG